MIACSVTDMYIEFIVHRFSGASCSQVYRAAEPMATVNIFLSDSPSHTGAPRGSDITIYISRP